MRELTFTSAGVECAAWHLPAAGDRLAGERAGRASSWRMASAGRATRLCSPFAEGFAEAGLDVLLFDYRGFGASDGHAAPADLLPPPARRLPRRDRRRAAHRRRRPERIVLWGTSYSGGHVIAVAAADPGVAAVISMTPATDGLAALRAIVRHGGPRRIASLVGQRPPRRSARGDGARRTSCRSPARPVRGDDRRGRRRRGLRRDRRSDLAQRGLRPVGPRRRLQPPGPLRASAELPAARPDRRRRPVAPPAAAATARAPARAELRHYPVDHFDVYAGRWQQRRLADQLDFLNRHFAGQSTHETERAAA